MARLSIFKKLFEPKSSSSFANETSTSNNPTRPSFSKLKTSSRLRYHILRAAFRTRTTLPDSTDDDAPTNGLGFSQCLPAIDGIGTGLQLDFDHQGDGEPSTSVALAKEHSETGAFLLNHVGDSDLVISRTWCQPPERLFRSRVTTERGGINVRNSISIFSDPQYPSQIRVQPAAPFVDVSYETITSIVAVPRSPSVTLRAEETSSPSQEAPSTIVPSSPNVTLYPDSNSTSGKTNSTFLLEAADQTSLTPEPDSDTSVSDITEKNVDHARLATYKVSTALDAQQAVLDYAEVYATVAHSVSGEKLAPPNKSHEKQISHDELSSFSQDADLLKVENEGLSLANVVLGHRPRRSQWEVHNALTSSVVSKDQKNKQQEKAWDLDQPLAFYDNKVAFLEAIVRELHQEKQELKEEIELFEENKDLISKVNERKVEDLEAENKRLALRNCLLHYDNRQTQVALGGSPKTSENNLSFKDSQIDLLDVDKKSLKVKIDELEVDLLRSSKASQKQALAFREEISAKDEQLAETKVRTSELEASNAALILEGSIHSEDLYKKRTGLSPDQWKALIEKLTPKYHALLADFKESQAQLLEVEGKQEKTESALREAQTEAWTRKHLHEEVCRALEASHQMHKEANECAAVWAEKFESLETLYRMSRQVSERLLADSWQANATKEARIKMLTMTLSPGDIKQTLDHQQVELHGAESRLVATQRLVEGLDKQLCETKTKHAELEVENKKLECQLGEAKVRLDHDYEDEERLKSELEKARADVEEYKQCADGWQCIAIAELDQYSPDVIKRVKEDTLTTLQEKIDEANARTEALVGYNQGLEVHLNDLEYELGINERRLTMGESIKVDFYERHWRTVQEIFEENKLKTAMIKAFEARFSEDLAKYPVATPALSPETFEDHVGPEFIDRTNALYRMADEAREGRGANDLRHSDLDTERIKAIYGHGPAGYKPRPEKEMPEDLKEQLWQLTNEAEDGPGDENWETEGVMERDVEGGV